jgi:Tfp pilus assembly protein FimT
LVELLIVITLMVVLTAAVMPRFESSVAEQLETTAQIVAADLDYARSLAVSNGSKYRVTFDESRQRYVLEHSGSNSALNTLPSSAFGRPGGSTTQHVVEMASLPHLGPVAELAGVRKTTNASQVITDVEFGPIGALTRSESTLVWLACGKGSQRMYLPVVIDSATGLTSIGDAVASRPTGLTR